MECLCMAPLTPTDLVIGGLLSNCCFEVCLFVVIFTMFVFRALFEEFVMAIYEFNDLEWDGWGGLLGVHGVFYYAYDVWSYSCMADGCMCILVPNVELWNRVVCCCGVLRWLGWRIFWTFLVGVVLCCDGLWRGHLDVKSHMWIGGGVMYLSHFEMCVCGFKPSWRSSNPLHA